MVPREHGFSISIAAAAVVALLAATSPACAATLVYDAETLRSLSHGATGLGPDDAVVRPTTISDEKLAGLSTEEMASTIRRAIDESERPGFTPHVIAIDEVGNHFRDPPPRTRYRTVTIRGTRYRIASHNRIVITRNGWRLVRDPPEPTRPGPDHPGTRLSRAMGILAEKPAPWGGTYAERVHMLVAPAMVTSVGAGRGRHFTLGRTGSRAIRRAWRGVVPGLTRAGGVWLQMYHGDRNSVSALQWRRAPGRMAKYLARHGGDPARVHLLFTAVSRPPAGVTNCGGPMACQWAAARASGATRAVLANGVGAYRLDQDAAGWLRELRRSPTGA